MLQLFTLLQSNLETGTTVTELLNSYNPIKLLNLLHNCSKDCKRFSKLMIRRSNTVPCKYSRLIIPRNDSILNYYFLKENTRFK